MHDCTSLYTTGGVFVNVSAPSERHTAPHIMKHGREDAESEITSSRQSKLDLFIMFAQRL